MAPILWKPEFSVGDPAVDHEHRELVELVNTAAGAMLERRPEADIDRSLGDLLRAVSAHFAHEERQMRRAGYDQHDPHKADHERLIDSLREIMDDAAAGAGPGGAGPGSTGPGSTGRGSAEPDTADRLTAVLEAWFTDHFRTHDARLHHKLGPHEH